MSLLSAGRKEIPGLVYYADQTTIERSGISAYAMKSTNPDVEQVQKDLSRTTYVICFGDKTFDSAFLGAVFYISNGEYTSRDELIKRLLKLGLTTEHIEQQLTYLQDIFDLNQHDFDDLLKQLGQPSKINGKLRQTMLRDLFYAIVGDSKKADCLFQVYGQEFSTYMSVNVVTVQCQFSPQPQTNILPAASKYKDMVKNIEGKLEVGPNGTLEFISPSALTLTFADDDGIQRIVAGTTEHKIVIDTVAKKSVVSEFTASNKVLYHFGINREFANVTRELLDLGQAEENLNKSLLLCNQFGLLSPEEIHAYITARDALLNKLNLATATPEELQNGIMEIESLHNNGPEIADGSKRIPKIPSTIKDFFALKAEMQHSFYNHPLIKCNTGLDDKWLTCKTPRDYKQLATINLLLQIQSTDINANESLFVMLMVAEYQLKKLVLDEKSELTTEQKAQFVNELEQLKNDPALSMLDKLKSLNEFLIKYNNLLVQHKPLNKNIAELNDLITSVTQQFDKFWQRKDIPLLVLFLADFLASMVDSVASWVSTRTSAPSATFPPKQPEPQKQHLQATAPTIVAEKTTEPTATATIPTEKTPEPTAETARWETNDKQQP